MLLDKCVFQIVYLLVSTCVIDQCIFAQDVLTPTDKALKVIDEITVRVPVQDNRAAPGILFDSSGVVLVHTASLEFKTPDSITLPDGKVVPCQLLYKDEKLAIAVFIISNVSEVPRMNYVMVRDPSTMQETEALVTKSCAREGFLFTRVGSLAFLSTAETQSSAMIIQMPVTGFSAGSPLLDMDGRLAGYLNGKIDIESSKIYHANPFTAVLNSLSKQPEYSSTYNSTFNGITFKDNSLVVAQTVKTANLHTEAGHEIVTVNGASVKNIHDLKMACWVAKVRKQDSLALGIRSGNQNAVRQVRLK